MIIRFFILIILLAYLYILILNKRETLVNNKKYVLYELGDIIKGYIAKNDKFKFKNYPKKFPNSIASKYIKEIKDLPSNQKWNNIDVLRKITQNNNSLGVSLHLRSGDVLGNYNYKKKEFNRNHTRIYFYQPKVHKKKDKNTKKYVKIIKDLIKKNDILVIDNSNGNPDEDFIKMSNSKIFIKSGGGFSRIISFLVKSRNNEIIDPKNYS